MRQTTPDRSPTPPQPPDRPPTPPQPQPVLESAVEPSPELVRLLATLRARVVRHVAERRAAGASPERIVAEVRCLTREAESCEGWRDPSDTLLRQVVRWSIEAYYDEPELQHVPRFY
jgi:hypothetical protein